jgi:hypothetical protein
LLNFFIGDVVAAITGLDPVKGALVELIHINDEGEQVGGVLATTYTSTNGGYTLTLPTGVNLAGNLVVRITGSGKEVRAQVVQQEVNISPVSEFILRKFIENETNLQVLDPGAVVKLSGRIEEFDLTINSDLSAVFAQLDAAVGEFIDAQIDVISVEPDSAISISGAYRSASLQLALHDSNDVDWGTFAVDMWRSEFVFNGKDDGSVELEHLGEETAWGSISGKDTGHDRRFNYWTDIDDESNTYAASFNKAGVLAIEGEFDEEIDEDFAWRWPPVTYLLQKVRDQNLFFQLNQEAGVRYETIDTDNDGTNDALDPDAPVGDEVNRGIEVFYKKATELTTASVNGSYGRVYLGVLMNAYGSLEVEVETNELRFDNGSFAYGAAERNRISRNAAGDSKVYVEQTEPEDLAIEVAPDGRITVDGEPTDGYFNDTADLAVMLGSFGEEGEDQAGFDETFFVKLPESAPNLTGKRYRLMYLNTKFFGTAIEMTNSRFDSFVTFTSNTAGTASLGINAISKGWLGADIFASALPTSERVVTATVGDKGATTLQINSAGGYLRLKGYWNSTASYGLFTIGFISTLPGDSPEPESVGLAVLVEVNDEE